MLSSSVSVVHAGRAMLSPGGPTVTGVEVQITGETVTSVAVGRAMPPANTLTLDDDLGSRSLRESPDKPTSIGGAGTLLMPALADAHDHGRGLATIAFGAADAALETWISALSLQPHVDSYLLTAFALCKLARSGAASVVHCHNTQRSEELVEECVQAGAAARDIGIRMAIGVPLADRNRLGYAPDDEVLACVDDEHRSMVAQRWGGAPVPAHVQVAAVEEIAARSEAADGLVRVQYCPVAPQWCSDELLAAVAESSERNGRRVHMHLLETRYQREWADATYPSGLLRHLDSLGLLSDRLTVAHGVWLNDDELMLLAERGVTVSVNTTSNLRLRSGTARLRRMLDLGVKVAFGMDGMSIDDDDDVLRELQMAHLMHAGVGLDRGVSVQEVFHGSCAVGPGAVGHNVGTGSIAVGSTADLMLLDRESYSGDVADGAVENEATLVLARARARHVKDLVVAGRHVVVSGRVAGVDEDAITAEVADRCRHANLSVHGALEAVTALQRGLTRFYLQGGHRLTTASKTASIASSDTSVPEHSDPTLPDATRFEGAPV